MSKKRVKQMFLWMYKNKCYANNAMVFQQTIVKRGIYKKSLKNLNCVMK